MLIINATADKKVQDRMNLFDGKMLAKKLEACVMLKFTQYGFEHGVTIEIFPESDIIELIEQLIHEKSGIEKFVKSTQPD